MVKTKEKKVADLAKETGETPPIPLPFPLFYPNTLYNLENTTARMESFVPSPVSYCAPNRQTVDISGWSVTGPNGQNTWKLSENMCLPQNQAAYQIDGPISFVATPRTGEKPTYLTTSVTTQDSPKDLIVQVYSWDQKGKPAPNVAFNWRCRFGYPAVVGGSIL